MHLAHLGRTLLTTTLAPALVAGVLVAAPPAQAAERRPPQRIELPRGFQPEGITIRRGTAYLGSRVDGDVYAADLRTGKGRRIHQGDGTPAVGLKIDRRSRLWVAGGDDGDAKVVNARTGRLVADLDLTAGSSAPSFVNDVVLRRGSAWFTDSQRAVLTRVPLKGRPSQARVRTLPLTGQWSQVAGQFNANGISTTPDGRALLVVQSVTGKLFRVNVRTGRAVQVALRGYALTNGDGMLRRGRLLHVVQNRDDVVAVVRLARDGRSGRLVRTLTSPDFDVPTTVAAWRGALYLPNARFSTTPTPSTPYWITRVRPGR